MSPGAQRGPSPAARLPLGPSMDRRTRCRLPATLPLGYLGDSSSNTEAGTPRRRGTAQGTGLAQGRGGCSLSRRPCAGHPGDGGRGAWWQPARGEAVDGWRQAGADLTEASTWAQPAVLREPLEAVFQQHGDDPVQVRYLTRAGSKNKAGEGVLLEPCSLAVRSATACLSPFPESAPASLDSPRRPDCCGPSCFFQAGLPLPIFLFNNGLGPARERQSAGLQAGAESSP